MTTTELPHWDLSEYFPGLDSRELASAHEGFGAEVERLAALYDEHGVRELGSPDGEALQVDDDTVAAFEAVTDATNRILDQARLLGAYVHAFVTTDARNDAASALASQLEVLEARLRSLSTRYAAWVASLGAETLASRSIVAADHDWPLRKAERTAEHLMAEGEEGLYSELALTGSSAWNRLHGEVTSLLEATVDLPGGEPARLPITAVRGLATDPDAAVRRAAYDAELRAWPTVEVPLAAAMNAIKGEVNAVNRRRGWEDSLAPALHMNAVDRGTLAAMQEAVVDSLPQWRRYLRAKATELGSGGANGGLPWWDLVAPVGDPDAAHMGWDDAVAEVLASFRSYSPSLAGLAERAFRDRWVDAEPRTGKRGGAFCMQVQGGDSRVLLNFAPSFDSVSTLAHELGHAYHNLNLGDRTAMQRATPMALAETASIFCETLLVQAGMTAAAEAGDDQRQLVLLGTDLDGGAQVVVDIHSRFLFEKAVFERRAERTLSAGALSAMMLDAQEEAYGDGLDEHRHPYMWAVKPHYYSRAYYNWPYTFGLLFGIGLYARYVDDPERFRSGYDDLLASTGLGDAAELAGRFGIDIRATDFWASSLDVLHRRIDTFCALATPELPKLGTVD